MRHIKKQHPSKLKNKQLPLNFPIIDPHSPAIQEQITVKLVQWIVHDLQSFQVVDNIFFQNFIKQLDSRYTIPCRQTIKARIISDFEYHQNILKSFIKQISVKVTLTTDLWTSNTMKSYLALTIHFINSSWKLQHFV